MCSDMLFTAGGGGAIGGSTTETATGAGTTGGGGPLGGLYAEEVDRGVLGVLFTGGSRCERRGVVAGAICGDGALEGLDRFGEL
jgi:hypothetical protein